MCLKMTEGLHQQTPVPVHVCTLSLLSDKVALAPGFRVRQQEAGPTQSGKSPLPHRLVSGSGVWTCVGIHARTFMAF